MIRFRQKDFSKLKEAFENLKKTKFAKIVKKGATPTAVGLGVANLSLNLSRKKKDTELREEQIEAMNNLAKALNKYSKSQEVRDSSKKVATSFRKKHPESISEEDVIILPNPVSYLKKFK